MSDITEYQAYEGVCPRCTAIWGMDEVDRNHCFACGYPDENEFDSDYDEYDEDYHTCNCRFCFCASHVQVAGETCDSCLCGSHQG